MNKLMMAVVAGCMSAAMAGAYAASGSPADTDKAGRMGPGTAAGEQGAVQPTPGKAGKGASSSTATGAGAGSGAASSSSTGAGASATSGAGGASATTGGGMDDTKSGRRARRASKG